VRADAFSVPPAVVPNELTRSPFRGTRAIAKGLLTRRQIDGRTWLRLFPDIYAWEGLTLDHRKRCLAVRLFLNGRGAVSGLDAAALWGADATEREAPIEVTIPDRQRVRAQRGLEIVRSRLPPGDVRGNTTTPLRTVFDLARRKNYYGNIPGIDAMLHAGLTTAERVRDLAAARKGWHGRHRVPAVLSFCDGRAESPPESRLRLILLSRGLPRPEVQFEVRDQHGRFAARLDLAYPEFRLGVEYDGDQHRTRAAFRNDPRRLNDLRTCGWTVLRFASADLYNPDSLADTVRRALRPR
jgi:very-short-patch-repair endonuclease